MERLTFAVDMEHESAYDSSISSVTDIHDPSIHIIMPSKAALRLAERINKFINDDSPEHTMISVTVTGGSITIEHRKRGVAYTITLQDNNWLEREQDRAPTRTYRVTKYGLGMLANNLTVSALLRWDDASCQIPRNPYTP